MRRELIRGAIVVALALTACGGDEAEPTTTASIDAAVAEDDLNDDLECGWEQHVGPKASGTLTNNGAGQASYIVSVNFMDAGGTIIDQATAFANNIPAGDTSTWEAQGFNVDVAGAYERCRIVDVTRAPA